MKSARLRCPLIAALALCAVGATSCEVEDDDCDYDDDDFDDDDFDDSFDDDDFDDDDIYGCSYIIIVGQSKGGVVVLLTDRPRPGILAARVTIGDVTLQSREVDPEPLYLHAAGRRVDLLSLRGTADTRIHDVLASRGSLAPAVYDAIRFTVRDPSLVLSSGETIEPRDIDIAGEGNMAIDFAEPLLLGPSDVVYIVLDFDLERSLSAAGGARLRWTLRPIVLAEVLREDVGRAVRAPTDLSGVVAKVERDRSAFDLELSDGRGALRVRLAPGAAVRGEGLEPLPAAAIRAGSQLLARGAWTEDGSLLADSVVLGDTFEALGLVHDVAPSGGGCLGARVLVTAGQHFEGDLFLEACPRTLVSLDRIGPLGVGDLREGMMVAVRAHAAGQSPARAAIIDVKQGHAVLDVPQGDAEKAEGAVIAVDEASGIVALSAGSEILEVEAGDALILLLEEAGGALRERPIPIQDVAEGMHVEALGGTADRPGHLLIVTPGEPGGSEGG